MNLGEVGMLIHPPKSNWKGGFLGFQNGSAKKIFFLLPFTLMSAKCILQQSE